MHFKVRATCDDTMLAQFFAVIHANRWQSSRRTISLLVTNPRITVWPMPESVFPKPFPYALSLHNSQPVISCNFTVDVGSLHNSITNYPPCHREPVTDVTGVAIRILKTLVFQHFLENGLPRQCAHGLAMTKQGNWFRSVKLIQF